MGQLDSGMVRSVPSGKLECVEVVSTESQHEDNKLCINIDEDLAAFFTETERPAGPPRPVTVENDALVFANGTKINFQRTLRLPEDGKVHSLPPGFGRFPLTKCSDYPARSLPRQWRNGDDVFMPLRKAEALWLSWTSTEAAIMVGAGGVNAISGEGFEPGNLKAEPQSYCVAPRQPWLDGIKSGNGVVSQFVSTTRGSGASVEAQVCGDDFRGGLQLFVCAPKKTTVRFFPSAEAGAGSEETLDFYKTPRELGLLPGSRVIMERFVDDTGGNRLDDYGVFSESTLHLVLRLRGGPPAEEEEMALAVGGKMRQDVYPDPHGPRYWDATGGQYVNVHLAGPAMYTAITRKVPPATPVTAAEYTAMGFPWFSLFDENVINDIEAPEVLSLVKSIAQVGDAEAAEPLPTAPCVTNFGEKRKFEREPFANMA